MSNVIKFPMTDHNRRASAFIWHGLDKPKPPPEPEAAIPHFTLTVSIHPTKGAMFSVVYPTGILDRKQVADFLRDAARALELPRIKL